MIFSAAVTARGLQGPLIRASRTGSDARPQAQMTSSQQKVKQEVSEI